MTPELSSFDYDVSDNVKKLLELEDPETAKEVLEESLEETLVEEKEAWKNSQPGLAEDLRCEASVIEQELAKIAIKPDLDQSIDIAA